MRPKIAHPSHALAVMLLAERLARAARALAFADETPTSCMHFECTSTAVSPGGEVRGRVAARENRRADSREEGP